MADRRGEPAGGGRGNRTRRGAPPGGRRPILNATPGRPRHFVQHGTVGRLRDRFRNVRPRGRVVSLPTRCILEHVGNLRDHARVGTGAPRPGGPRGTVAASPRDPSGRSARVRGHGDPALDASGRTDGPFQVCGQARRGLPRSPVALAHSFAGNHGSCNVLSWHAAAVVSRGVRYAGGQRPTLRRQHPRIRCWLAALRVVATPPGGVCARGLVDWSRDLIALGRDDPTLSTRCRGCRVRSARGGDQHNLESRTRPPLWHLATRPTKRNRRRRGPRLDDHGVGRTEWDAHADDRRIRGCRRQPAGQPVHGVDGATASHAARQSTQCIGDLFWHGTHRQLGSPRRHLVPRYRRSQRGSLQRCPSVRNQPGSSRRPTHSIRGDGWPRLAPPYDRALRPRNPRTDAAKFRGSSTCRLPNT